MDLLAPIEPLTPRQRTTVWIVAAVCAASRFLAMARTLWDWDETLFCLGMRNYDVALHHPHPPGFPVFIAIARIVRLVVHDDFRSLQAVSLISGALLFPVMFLLARELRLRFETATIAAALCAFFPNVWFFGGTAFSDVPSIVLVVAAVAMLIRGCRDAEAYLIGTVLLALAIGIRPQNLLVGLWPGFVATRYRLKQNWRDVIWALTIGVVIAGVSYFSAMIATGSSERYFAAIRGHADYITRIDSWRSPDRPALWRLFDRFFIKQYQSPVLSVVTSIFVLVSAVGAVRNRDRRIGMLTLAFGPFAISAWLMLDRFSINRFSIGYCPMFAILAADGIDRITARRRDLEWLVGAALILAFVIFTWPALTVVRTTESPSYASVQAIRKHLDPARDQLYVGFAMTPFVEYLDPAYSWTRVLDERAMPLSNPAKRAWLLTEIDVTKPGGYFFTRPHGQLWHITRRHYFDVALEPLAVVPQFVSGWYGPERNGQEENRWMGGHSTTILPGRNGDSVLRLVYDIPDELMRQHPTVTVKLNGVIIDQSQPADAHLSRDFHVQPAANNAPNTLELDIDRTINPRAQHLGDDPRELGLLIHFLAWGMS
jgi:dolichyl-phosphate-mannose-protein mannosyltransferase